MKRYIGLDAHSQSCTVAVRGERGQRICQQVVETSGPALRQAIGGLAGERHVCLEEGALSEWLYEVLSPLASEVVVVQTAARPGPKSDALDAWELADVLREGRRMRRVFKPVGQLTGLRVAVRGHRVAMRELVRSKNRLKGLYRSRGVWTPGAALYRQAEQTTWQAKLPPEYRELAAQLHRQVQDAAAVAEQAERWLQREALQYAVVGLVATAPGIGEVRAAQIVATVVTPQRFRTKRQFWSYCGLAVVTRSSSDWQKDTGGSWRWQPKQKTRGLNTNRHPLLKEVFKGAALTVVTRMPKHPLAQNYRRLLEQGTKPPLAQLTVARQIAAAVLAMWKSLEVYDPARHARKTA